jgi:hypothetical protein
MLTFSERWKISAAIGHHMVTRRRKEPAIWINANFLKSYSRSPVGNLVKSAVGSPKGG